MEKVNVTVRLETEAVEFLDSLGKSRRLGRSDLIEEAVQHYIAHRRWRAEEIKKAIAEADAGLFLSDEEAAAFMKKLGE